MTAPRPATFRVYDDTKWNQGTCRACRAPLDWYVTTQGRRMPVERDAAPIGVEDDRGALARRVLVFEASSSHFANCTQAAAFRRRRGGTSE